MKVENSSIQLAGVSSRPVLSLRLQLDVANIEDCARKKLEIKFLWYHTSFLYMKEKDKLYIIT